MGAVHADVMFIKADTVVELLQLRPGSQGGLCYVRDDQAG